VIEVRKFKKNVKKHLQSVLLIQSRNVSHFAQCKKALWLLCHFVGPCHSLLIRDFWIPLRLISIPPFFLHAEKALGLSSQGRQRDGSGPIHLYR